MCRELSFKKRIAKIGQAVLYEKVLTYFLTYITKHDLDLDSRPILLAESKHTTSLSKPAKYEANPLGSFCARAI
jgi:hypothetical protein